MLEPEPPTAFPGLAGKTRFRTDGFKYCSEVGSAWTMVEWVLLEQADPNGPVVDHTFLPSPNGVLHPGPQDPNDVNAYVVWAYALEARVYDALGIYDPNNPLTTFHSKDICVDSNRTMVDDDYACPDLDNSQPQPPPPAICCAPPPTYGNTWQDEEMHSRMGVVRLGGGTSADMSLAPLPGQDSGPEAEWQIATTKLPVPQRP
jgi:hypothetical protein